MCDHALRELRARLARSASEAANQRLLFISGGFRGRGASEQPAETREGFSLPGPRHNEIDHSVVAQVLRPLKALRQALANCLLDDPRAREFDHGAGLSDMHIAEHRV